MTDDLTRSDWDNLRWIAHMGGLSIRRDEAQKLVVLGYITVEPCTASAMFWAHITPDGQAAHTAYMRSIGKMCKCTRSAVDF